MNTMQIIFFLGLAVLILATQLGRHTLSLRRLVMPLLIVGGVAFSEVKSIPTIGGDLDFEMACAIAGVACGILAASLVTIERDGASGKIVTRAGLGYATVWVLVLGGRLAFGWAATHGWRDAVAQFSIARAITGEAAWTAAFILMAMAMVAARTIVLTVRSVRIWYSHSKVTHIPGQPIQ